jgi:outer membrane protein W
MNIKKKFMQINTTVNIGSDSYTINVNFNPTVFGIDIGYRFS